MTHVYQITGMTCLSCVGRVKSELLKLGDVLSADVQLASPQLTLVMAKHINTQVLQKAIEKAGNYKISEAGHMTQHSSIREEVEQVQEKTSYFPIFLIFSYITIASFLVQAVQERIEVMEWMAHFMAGFFLVFSFFKLISLKGFAEGYRTYDVIAKKIPAWGFIYPFVELGLGIAFLTGFAPLGTNIVTLLVMGVSSIGVIQALMKKTTIQCACLGTVIKLPLGKVTLVEDGVMVLMSAVMILLIV